MKVSGVCLLLSLFTVVIAAYARLAGGLGFHQATVSMLALFAAAVSSLGALELRIHRRVRSEQQKKASRLASALRNGALR